MTIETEINFDQPRTHKTFFPHNDEAVGIWKDSDDDVKVSLRLQPQFAFQFLHELWRTGRDQLFFEIMSKEEEMGLQTEIDPSQNLHKCVALCVFSQENIENWKNFFTQFYTIYFKIRTGLGQTGILDSEWQEVVDAFVNRIDMNISLAINRYKAAFGPTSSNQ